jgi:hypothetical protein
MQSARRKPRRLPSQYSFDAKHRLAARNAHLCAKAKLYALNPQHRAIWRFCPTLFTAYAESRSPARAINQDFRSIANDGIERRTVVFR